MSANMPAATAAYAGPGRQPRERRTSVRRERASARATFESMLMAPGLLIVAVLLIASCGGIISPDLFAVERSGSSPGASLTLVVSEEGVVHCNHGPAYRLSDPAVIQARTIQEELHGAASHHLALRAQPGSVFGYRVRNGEGSVSFADNSAGQPSVLRHLQLFVVQVAQGICHLST
jgi:hypothetical protein